jgi:hypothetical protein
MSKIVYDTARKQLTLQDSRLYFFDDGSYAPSCTTYLSCYPKGPEYYEWLKKYGKESDDIRDAQGYKGNNVHKMCEMYDKGEEVSILRLDASMQYTMAEWSHFEKYVEFSKKYRPIVYSNEQTLISKKYNVGLTLDRIMGVGGSNILIDIKTSNYLWDHMWLQLAACRKVYEHEMRDDLEKVNIHRVGILWLAAKTRTDGKKDAMQGKGWQLVLRDVDEEEKDWELFQHVQALWNAQNKDVKPRNITYQLSHKKL